MPHKSKHSPKARKPLADTPQPVIEVELRPLLRVFRVVGFFLLLAAIIGWMAPWERIWGLHGLAFLNPIVSAFLAIGAALLLSPAGSRIVAWLGDHLGWFAKRGWKFWAIAAFASFLVLRVSTPVLGDGQLWIQQLAMVAELEARGKDLPEGRVSRRKEPLEIGLHEAAFRAVDYIRQSVRPMPLTSRDSKDIAAMQHAYKTEARYVYAILSAIAGGIFIALVIRFARKHLNPAGRSLFITVMVSGGGMLLFFGYVEHYSWASLGIVACLLTGLEEAARPSIFPWKTVLIFALAVGLHLASIILFPAVVFLCLAFVMQRMNAGLPKWSPTRYSRAFMAALAIFTVGGYLVLKVWRGRSSILPLLPQWSRDGYALLATPHLVDFLNLLALVVPSALVIVLCLRWARNENMAIRQTFLTIAAAVGALFALIFNPNLGMPRDWDLLALSLWPLTILGAWKLAITHVNGHRSPLLAALLGIMLIGTLPYVLVNAVKDASLNRYSTLLHLDPRRAGYGWENLARYYEENNESSKAIQAWQSAVSVDPNPRYKLNLGNSLRLAGRLDEAEPFYIAAAKGNKNFVSAVYKLAFSYYQKGNPAKGIELVQMMTELSPADARFRRLLENLKQPANRMLSDSTEDN